MARAPSDLQIIPQRITSDPVSFTPNNSFAAVGNAFSDLAGLAAEQLQKIDVAQQTEAGQLEAFKEEGKKKFPLTAGARAFNDSFKKMDLNIHYSSGESGLKRLANELTSDRNLSSSSLAEFNTISESAIEGTLSNSLPENIPMLKFKLDSVRNRLANNVANKVEGFDFKAGKDASTNVLANQKDSLLQAARDGDKDMFTLSSSTINETLDDAKTFGYLNGSEIEAYRKSLLVDATTEDYKRQYLEAVAIGQGAKESFLSNLAKGDIEGLTSLQSDEVKAGVYKFDVENDELVSDAQSLNKSHVNKLIQFGAIKNLTDLEAFRQDLSAKDYEDAQVTLFNKFQAEVKAGEDAVEFQEAVAKGDGSAKILGPARANQEWKRLVAELAKTKEANGEEVTLLDEGILANSLGVPVNDYATKVGFALEKGTPEQAQVAAQIFREFLASGNMTAIEGLSVNEKAIGVAAFTYMSDGSANALEAIAEARNVVLNSTDQQRKNRNSDFDNFKNQKNGLVLKKDYKEVFGAKPTAFSNAFDQFEVMYRDAYNILGTRKMAKLYVKDQMSKWGEDSFGKPGQITNYAVTKTIGNADDGPWLKNQEYSFYYNLSQNNESIGWAYDDNPSGWDEAKLYSEGFNSFPTVPVLGRGARELVQPRPQLIIGGKKRTTYLVGDNLTLLNFSNKPSYLVMYDDENGFAQNVVGDDGFPVRFNIETQGEYIPTVMRDLITETSDKFDYKYRTTKAIRKLQNINIGEDLRRRVERLKEEPTEEELSVKETLKKQELKVRFGINDNE